MLFRSILCKTAKTGAIDVTVSGGNAPYQYVWSNNAITRNVNGLSAGIYSVTITDANGCSLTKQATLTQPDSLQAILTNTNILCKTAKTGAIDVTVSGGNAPYQYAWSNGAITQNIANLSAGVYSVTVTDANGCSLTKQATLTQPDSLQAILTNTNILCKTAKTGAIDVTVSGGNAPYQYVWSNGAITQNTANLSAGFTSPTVERQVFKG